MRFRLSLLCLSLCAAPLAAQPLRSGEMRLSPAAPAGLVPRAEDFAASLCSGGQELDPVTDPGPDPLRDSARCCAKYKNKPCGALVAVPQFGIVSMHAAGDGTLRVSLFARAFALTGPKAIETPCGRWTYSLWLDPRVTQPVSALTLRRGAHAAGAGTFADAFPVRAQLAFDKVGDKRRVVVPVVLRLDLAGTWTVTAAESSATGAPADSRLLLSIDSIKGVMTPEGGKK